jgi:hypothetical protein
MTAMTAKITTAKPATATATPIRTCSRKYPTTSRSKIATIVRPSEPAEELFDGDSVMPRAYLKWDRLNRGARPGRL